ncbi:MAG: DUF423 domain-containing protein [Candidatus Thorarchaeota archaeon]
MNEKNLWLIIGTISAALAVIMGAFGAHILEPIVSEGDFITYQKAVRYQMYHSFGLIVVALLSSQGLYKPLKIAGWCFFIGIILFSGSLYLIVFTGLRGFGVITPVGGVAFVLGWISLAFSGFRGNLNK